MAQFKPTDEHRLIYLNLFDDKGTVRFVYKAMPLLKNKYGIEEKQHSLIVKNIYSLGLIEEAGGYYRLTEKGRKVKELGGLEAYDKEERRKEDLTERLTTSTITSNTTTIWVSWISIVISIAALLITIFKN